jgi:NAD(P)-dependent dehydrogenase (short-subunit alcohol dehydrogenase family)
MESHCYAVTGASSGLGLESVRQLASIHSKRSKGAKKPITTEIYMLCRNESRATNAMAELFEELFDDVSFKFIQFDSSNRSSVKNAIKLFSSSLPSGQVLNGLLLNAGGFTPDRNGSKCQSGATIIAKTNLIGHAALVDGLLDSNRLDKGSRVVFSGSEAGMGELIPYIYSKYI